jgi:hypothetical protein
MWMLRLSEMAAPGGDHLAHLPVGVFRMGLGKTLNEGFPLFNDTQ